MLVKNRETSLYEIPSVMWLHEHQPHLVQNALAGHGYKEIVSLLGTMIPPDKVRACLILAKNLCPQNWALQPDLIGEYFLDELWSVPVFYDSTKTLPDINDASLQRQLLVAWRISPDRTANTLSQLNASTCSPPAYVRALTLLSSAIAAGEPTSKEVVEISRLLFNAMVRVDKNKQPAPLFDQLLHALTQLAVGFPENNGVAYRHLKGLGICAGRFKGADQFAAWSELLARAPNLIVEMKTNSLDQFELYWADHLTHLIKDAWEKRNGELLSEVLNSAVVLRNNFSGPCELYGILSNFYYWISTRLAGTNLPQDELTSDVEVLTRRFAHQVEEDIYHCAKCDSGSLSHSAKTSLAWSMVDISFAYSKIGDIEHTVEIRSRIELACESLGNTEETKTMRTKSMFNAQTVLLNQPTLDSAYDTVADAVKLLAEELSEDRAELLLIMIGRMLEAAVAHADITGFLHQFKLLINTIPSLPDTSKIRATLAQALNSATTPPNAEWVNVIIRAAAEALRAERNEGHIPSEICLTKMIATAIGGANERSDADALLSQVIYLAATHPHVPDVCTNALHSAIVYWVHYGSMTDLRFNNVCEIVVQPNNMSPSTQIEARLFDSVGNIFSTMIVAIEK